MLPKAIVVDLTRVKSSFPWMVICPKIGEFCSSYVTDVPWLIMTLFPANGNFPFSQIVGLDHAPLAMLLVVNESECEWDIPGMLGMPGISSIADMSDMPEMRVITCSDDEWFNANDADSMQRNDIVPTNKIFCFGITVVFGLNFSI
jgi:hypothetical protein